MILIEIKSENLIEMKNENIFEIKNEISEERPIKKQKIEKENKIIFINFIKDHLKHLIKEIYKKVRNYINQKLHIIHQKLHIIH